MKSKKYLMRTDPCDIYFINEAHNFYRYCDMDISERNKFLDKINEWKKILWDVEGQSGLYKKLSEMFPYKDNESVYYKVRDRISEIENQIPSDYTPKMKLYQFLYIEMTIIIMDIFSIVDIYHNDDKIPKKKLTMDAINIALSKNNNYKHFYPQEKDKEENEVKVKSDLFKKLNINNKKEWKEWLLKNHSDKNINSDAELLRQVLILGKELFP